MTIPSWSHTYTGHNYMGHAYTGHRKLRLTVHMGQHPQGHNYTGHRKLGHSYVGHNYSALMRDRRALRRRDDAVERGGDGRPVALAARHDELARAITIYAITIYVYRTHWAITITYVGHALRTVGKLPRRRSF